MIILGTDMLSELIKPAPSQHVIDWLNALPRHEVANRYGDIVAGRARQGNPIEIADTQIAAICASRDAVLATRNIKDFEDTGIELINPWEQD